MRALLVAAVLAGCGASGPEAGDDAVDGSDRDAAAGDAPDGGSGPDGAPGPDADPAAPDATEAPPDANAGLPAGWDCDVLIDGECAAGLTCRVTDAQGGGKCRTVGALGDGDACTVTIFYANCPCGQSMACYNGGPDGECLILCDIDDPIARCGVARPCDVIIGDSVGVCRP